MENNMAFTVNTRRESM